MASAKIIKSAAAESSKLGFGSVNVSGGLIYGRIIGEFVSMLYLALVFMIKDFRQFSSSNWKGVIQSLKNHYLFPMYSMPSVFVGNFIYVIFFALFNKYFGEAKTGIIGISVTYVYAAFALLSASFSQVFLKEIHDIKGRDNLLKVYLKNAKLLALLSLFVTVFVLIIPSNWVVFLLGDKWNDMMPTLKILVFGFAVSFVTSSLSFIYIRLDKQKIMLLFDVLHLLLVWASITWAYNYFGTFKETLIVYTIAQVVYYLIAFIAAIFFIKRSKI
jgi:O-antigen/teichoic acid export membrane protein